MWVCSHCVCGEPVIGTLRRIATLLLLTGALLGAAATPAAANDQICPYVKIFGNHYEVCVPLP